MSDWIKRIGIPVIIFLLGWNLGIGYAQRGAVRIVPGNQSGSGVVATDPQKEVDPSLLWHTWNLLLQHYIEPEKLQNTALLNGAVEGMVRAVGDPYTVFMSPVENTEFRDALAGNLEGIGAELELRDGYAIIVTPLKGSPAERAGLLPEDVILEVNDETMEGQSLTDIVRRIRGNRGTSVKLLIARAEETEPVTFTIVRESIHIPSVEARLIEQGKKIGYVALNQFGEGSIEEVREELLAFQRQNVEAIILDLRGNGGGYLDGAVDLVSLFQKQGAVVTVEQRGLDARQQEVTGRPLFPDIPLVVLQNQASASASEITSGALQDHGRATVIGKTSFGKGTVQEIIDVPGGGSLRVTVAKWKTPKGKDLSKEGVHPDIEVDRTVEDFQAKRDPQLDAAVEFLVTGTVTNAVQNSSASSL